MPWAGLGHRAHDPPDLGDHQMPQAEGGEPDSESTAAPMATSGSGSTPGEK